jgi:hypothetical protein
MVAAGSIVHCEITSTETDFQSADSIVQDASSVLAGEGYSVVGASTNVGVVNILESGGWGYAFQANLDVLVPSSFAASTDVLSIVQNAFYQANGVYPGIASAPYVSSGGVAAPTGLPSLTPAGVGGTSADSAATAGINSFLNALKALLGNGLLLVAILIGVLIYVAGYSPNTRHVVGAFA